MSSDPRCGIVAHACHDTDTDIEERYHFGGVLNNPVVLLVDYGALGLDLAAALSRLCDLKDVPILTITDSPPCEHFAPPLPEARTFKLPKLEDFARRPFKPVRRK